MAERLPTVYSDEDSWGTILNEFLEVSHNPDGSLKTTLYPDDIRNYGAVADDVGSAADNVTAIEDALSAKGSATIPFGTFYIDDVSILSAGQSLRGVTVFGSILRLTSGASNGTNLVALQGSRAVVRDLTLYGNWDLSTPGQLGNGIKIEHSGGSAAIENFILQNVYIINCKSRGIHAHNASNIDIRNVFGNQFGLDGAYFEGDSAALPCASITIDGATYFTNAENGYSVRLKNIKAGLFHYTTSTTKGVLLTGAYNKNVAFHSCNFGTGVTGEDYIIDFGTSSGEGFSIENCTLSQVVDEGAVKGTTSWSDLYAANNVNETGVDFVDDNEEYWVVVNQGDTVFRAKDLLYDSDDDIYYDVDTLVHTETVTTTDDTPTTIYSFTIDQDQTVYDIEFAINCSTPSGTSVAGSFKGTFIVKVDDVGDASELAENITCFVEESFLGEPTIEITDQSTGSLVEVQVNGIAATTLSWKGKFSVTTNE